MNDDITPDILNDDQDALPDEALDRIVASARATYHVPPAPDLDTLWRGVEARRGHARTRVPSNRWRQVAGVAAALVVAFTLGRVSVAPEGSVAPAVTATPRDAASTPVTNTTSELLGQTAVLLTALPADGADPASDRRFAQQAGELLVTTRLVLDSRVAQGDPTLRALLEDLELMLAQVARLRAGETRTERELITEALQQQNLVPRIRTIAAGLGAGAD